MFSISAKISPRNQYFIYNKHTSVVTGKITQKPVKKVFFMLICHVQCIQYESLADAQTPGNF